MSACQPAVCRGSASAIINRAIIREAFCLEDRNSGSGGNPRALPGCGTSGQCVHLSELPFLMYEMETLRMHLSKAKEQVQIRGGHRDPPRRQHGTRAAGRCVKESLGRWMTGWGLEVRVWCQY